MGITQGGFTANFHAELRIGDFRLRDFVHGLRTLDFGPRRRGDYPASGLALLDTVARQATSTGLTPYLKVTFETNRDNVAPVANVVQPSRGAWSPADFVVRWEGFDPPNSDGSPGSGIRWYDGYYTTNGGSTWRIGLGFTVTL